jgi:hypothetical protein
MKHGIIIFLLVIALTGCSQQPEDGESKSESSPQDFAIIRIRDLAILPENPRTVTPLQVEMKLGGGEVARMEYQWLRNGNHIPGAIEPILGTEYLRKGDFISVTVRAKLSGGSGDEQTSDAVIIGNTQPVATFAGVEPATPTSGEKLKGLGVGYDHDRDNVAFVYQWMVNGEPVLGQDEQFLPNSHFRRGDQVQVTVTPYDGEEFGMPLQSAPVAIGNSPPEIVSDPPAHMADSTFRYAVQTVDKDGDPLKFSLEGETPAGLEIDPATGLIQWKPVMPMSEGTYVFQVVAEDPEGAKSVQQITLNYKPGT